MYISKSYTVRPQLFAVHLIPKERRRQRSVGPRPNRIRRRHGLSVSVSIDIEVHATMTGADALLHRSLTWLLRDNDRRNLASQGANRFKWFSPLQGNNDV